jgi:hypothetical protein
MRVFLSRHYYRNDLQYLEYVARGPSGELELRRHTGDPRGGPYDGRVTEEEVARMANENGVPWSPV